MSSGGNAECEILMNERNLLPDFAEFCIKIAEWYVQEVWDNERQHYVKL